MKHLALISAINKRYSNWRNPEIGEHVLRECISFIDDGLGDRDAELKLCSPDDFVYWQQLSEVLLTCQLKKRGISVNHPRKGPDMLLNLTGRRIHVEIITPTPKDLPTDWLSHKPGTAINFPHEQLALRWTAAIKEKAEVLIGNRRKGLKGYLEKNIVLAEDVYVIAINARLLRGFNGAFPELNGISQFPFAVEATMCLGPIEAKISRATLQIVESGHQYRPAIIKRNQARVATDTFFDDRFAPVSAIWAADLDETVLVEQFRPMAIVHNPNTSNPLPEKFLPAHHEFNARSTDEFYVLEKADGSLIDFPTSIEIEL